MSSFNLQNLVILAIVIITISFVAIFFFQRKGLTEKALWQDYSTTEYEVNGKKLKLIVAKSQVEWQKGLMYVRKPVDFDGMIFVSNVATPQIFWNKNTFVDLDIYWLRAGKVIGQSTLPSIEKSGIKTVSSPGFADTIIEVIR
jgi:uncharacterized membrane protein (UPF0127 family)